jgi:hypothetical protein
MARNIFYIYELSILLKLSILFVGKVRITPFNGSIFLMAPGHFYVVLQYLYLFVVLGFGIGSVLLVYDV